MNEDLLNKIARNLTRTPGTVRTAGKIEFVKDAGPVRRDIRVEGFDWTSDNLKNLAKILWAAQRSHSYAIAAYRLFSKMPSSGFSPDGLLGGRGYIQSVKDMRQSLATAVETMSSFTDTVHDEINAEHWKKAADEQISGMVQDATQVKANPEGFVEGEFQDDEKQAGFDPASAGQLADAMNEAEQPVANPDPSDFDEFLQDEEEQEDEEEQQQSQVAAAEDDDPFEDAIDLKKMGLKKKDEPASKLPEGAGEQGQGKTVSEMVMNTTSPAKGGFAAAMNRIHKMYEAYHNARTANSKPMSFEQFVDALTRQAGGDSSIPVETLPGPRVKHVGPGMADTEWGGYGDGPASDDPTGAGLPGGVNMSQPLYEDWTMDGVTGDDYGTEGDENSLKVSATKLASGATQENYSWLPGSSNDRNLNYYELGLSAEEVEWMKQHSAPELPAGIVAPKKKYDAKSLWDVEI
jgi:hypothetical protein